MSHNVKCCYCNKTFNRDEEPYVQVGSRRYGHAKCYSSSEDKKKKLQIIDPKDCVICYVCKEIINKKTTPYKQIGIGKFAHIDCAKKEESREKTDKEKLDIYICNLFKLEFVPPRIVKQINSYIGDYNFSYSGILKSLVYFYEVKKNSIEKANESIAIVPYVYKEAYTYYYSLWMANEKNRNKKMADYSSRVKEIVIPSPEIKVKKKNKFSFIEEDDIDEQ